MGELTMKRLNYARGTYLLVSYPWRIYHGGRAMCSDGKVRALKRIAETADTFFSIPASVEVRGRTVAGYVTVQTEQGLSTETADDQAVLKFIAYLYRKNAQQLPVGCWKRD